MQWHGLAQAQAGILARRQLRALGIDSDRVRNQVAGGRWAERSPTVVSCFTGPLTVEQLAWVGVLTPSTEGVVGGIHALSAAGLRSWERAHVTVLVPVDAHLPASVDGVEHVRTRRDLACWTTARGGPPRLRVEPAALLHASSCPSEREAQGLLAAVVQQRLTTVVRLAETLTDLGRTRRAPLMRRLLLELDGGAQSLAEVDVTRMCDDHRIARPVRQVARVDSDGTRRWTDCEWRLSDGRTLILEVDGAHHMAVGQWEDDLRRRRRLTSPSVVIVDCSARELRDEPDVVAADLIALGVPRAGA
ncbi:hypothetical protein KLP28_11025 [Nocardioidaceae bacterium]|nr:hypothetical protein KLP28_11025 [Nocardioidaceae bacterium]